MGNDTSGRQTKKGARMSAYTSAWRRLFEKWKASRYNTKTNEMSAKFSGAVGCGKKKKRLVIVDIILHENVRL